MGAFKSVWTQAATYPTEAQVQTGVDFGPTGADFTGTLSAGSAPTTPGTLIGQLVTLNEQGAVEQGATVSVQIIEGPGDAGVAYDSAVWTVTSDADGLVEFDGMIVGATYLTWRGDGDQTERFTVPESSSSLVSGSRFSITEVIGVEA